MIKHIFNDDNHLKTYLLILVPLFLGWLINTPYLGFYFPLPLSIAFLCFWFWTGMKFARINRSRIQGLLIGNSINIISFFLFLWSFYFVSENSRNLWVAGFSQLYALPTLSISIRIYHLTDPDVYTNEFVIISYALMSLVFVAGFIFKTRITD